MEKLINYILYFIVFLVPVLSQNKIDGIAAIVGKNIILHSDVLQQTQIIAMEKNINPTTNPYLFEKLYFTSLNNIINQYSILNFAEKDTNIIINNDEVDRALNKQIDDFIIRAGSEKQFLEMVGMSMRQVKSEYWKNIRDMMLVEKYQFSQIQNIDVSRIEVENFYDNFKDSIPKEPELYDFSIIEIPFFESKKTQQKTLNFLQKIKKQILYNNLSFDSLANIYSEDPGTASNGGYIGFTKRGTLVKEYEQAAYSMTINDISEPIKSPFGYHLIKLLDRQGEKISTQHILKTITFSNDDKKNIKDSLSNLITIINKDFFSFDSIANYYSKKYNNYSGSYKNIYKQEIPLFIKNYVSDKNNLLKLSDIIETDKGYAIIYFYKYKDEVIPNLKNSWDLLYQYAKQNKQNNVMNNLIKKIKSKTFIKIYYN